MKFILSIGSSEFLANSATQAAKIAELIGNLKPIRVQYTATDKIHRCNVLAADYTATVSITTANESQILTPEAFAEFEAQKQAEEKAEALPSAVEPLPLSTRPEVNPLQPLMDLPKGTVIHGTFGIPGFNSTQEALAALETELSEEAQP